MGIVDLLGLPSSCSCSGQNGDGSIRTSTCKDKAIIVRGPANRVHRRIMVGILIKLDPLSTRLFPNNNFTIIRA
jgi:hypothetical protein